MKKSIILVESSVKGLPLPLPSPLNPDRHSSLFSMVWPRTILDSIMYWPHGPLVPGCQHKFQNKQIVVCLALADKGTTVQSQSVYSTCVHTTGCTTQPVIDKENKHKHEAMKTTPKMKTYNNVKLHQI